jgi:mono/diheme cytochrome c family protein
MVETQSPWDHWFHNSRACGATLLSDFAAAHGTEAMYANLTPTEVNNSDPGKLEAFVEYNGSLGPHFGNDMYDSTLIDYEVDLTPGQPASNATPGTSPTWTSLYTQQVTGQNLAALGATTIPYHDCKQSDPNRLPQFTANFLGVVDGTVPKSAALTLADVNLDTPQALAERSLAPALGLTTAQQILANACLSCHNSNLDQTDSRASFNAQDLSKNTPSVYGVAMGRLKRGPTDLHRMPPPTHMTLTDSQTAILTAFFASQGGT